MPFGFYDGKVVVFGISASIQEIVESFQENFFGITNDDTNFNIEEFEESIRPFVGDNDITQLLEKMKDLYDLGYLPIEVKSLPEGSRVNPGIPIMTITNTHPDFAWLPNYLETFLSAQIWKLSTAATIADVYKRIFVHYAKLTGVDESFTLFQGHDFSSRGMSGIVDSARSGSAHLTSFMGSDSVSSVQYAKRYYDAQGFIAGSVPATEHSVMCMGQQEGEADTFRRVFAKYPNGIVSIVSDTWDYWNTITELAKELKPEIMSRGKDSLGFCKTVFRPDSGNPVEVIVGTERRGGKVLEAEIKGSVECLWETFGGTETTKGFKVLDEHVGLIYGDSITPQRAVDILQGLMDKGFASSNIVLGIGSYTYQYVTRDTLGFAMKATYAEINGVGVQIFKAPKTDSGKNSAKGMLRVDLVDGEYVLVDGLDSDDGGCLQTIFKDDEFYNLPTLGVIRERLSKTL
jgi:nicotinamide phosphoribosyltransferase